MSNDQILTPEEAANYLRVKRSTIYAGVGKTSSFSSKNLLLYVGRLSKDKNTATLLRAFRNLQRHRPNEFHLLVIGDGPERTQLRKL